MSEPAPAMEREKFDCQLCSFQFPTVISFKQHLCSVKHRQQYEKVYPNEICKWNKSCYTPWIFNKDKDYFLKNNFSEPVLGLSQMTLCFCSEYRHGFYLCHVCQQMFHKDNVVAHIFEGNHYSNYFAYTDPNVLSFCSVQSKHNSMMENIKKEQEKTGTGRLQVLHIPEKLFKEFTNRNYCQVMFLLNQNKSLSDIFKKSKPEKMTIQMYKDDLNRKHPLLGLQNIVECICTPHMHLSHYLCTLCSLHVSVSSLIIRHLLSFQHIFAYLNTWHPSTLEAKECYIKGSPDVACILADFARQAEKLQGPNEIQQVRMDTSQMLSVLNVRFREALSKIESIANKGSLIPTVKPGKKLEPTLSASGKIPTNVKQESMSEPATSGNSTLMQNIKEEYKESTTEPSASPAAPSYNFHCQNCSKKFQTNAFYCLHLSRSEHWENLEKTFGPVMDKQPSECRAHFYSYKYFTDQDILCVGVSVVVTILSHQLIDEPVHLCFACETAFPRHFLKFHMNSEKHVIQSLLYLNPWKLPFAWKGKLDDLFLKLQASLEEGETGPSKNIRILDVPPRLFPSAPPLNYSKVMEKLSQYHPLLMNGVPRRQTYSKLQGNDRFPILGRNFLVKYGQITSGWKFLCLLCERPLSSDDYTAHVFSWEHVVAFLENFHPGSLDLNTTNEEVLDLAKQAARIHTVANAQEIEFDSSQQKSDLMDFKTKVHRLSIKKETDGKGPLMPSIAPKNKLFPRQQAQEQNLDAKTNESNTVTKIQSIPGTAVEKRVDGFQSTEQKPHVQINEPMDISLQETNNLPNEKEVKEENNPMNPSEPSQLEEIKSAKSSSCKSMMSTASKRQRRLSDMDTSDSETENVEPKRMCLSNPEEKKEMANLQNVDETKPCTSSGRTADNSVPCTGRELLSHIQRRIRHPLIGLSVIYECVCNDRAPIYLCECCHLIFKELHIVKHLSEIWHYHCYLIRAGEQTPQTNDKYWRQNTTKLAAYWEKKEGCGKAQVVKLMPNDYESLALTNEYNKAFKIVKTHLARKITKITWSPALQEDSSRIVTISRKETSQQGMHMEIDPKPVATSPETKIPSTNEIPSKSLKETNLSGTPDLEQSVVDATIDRVTSTAPTPFSSSLLENDNSSAKTMDESESTNIAEDTSNATCTEAAKSSKSLCRFIMTRAVIPEVESKIINTPENTSDKIPYAMPHCFTTTGTPGPTARRVCNFMTAKSAARSIPTPAMTHLTATIVPASTCNSGIVTSNTQQMTSAMLAYKATDCTPISDVAASNAIKGAPNPQDKSFLPDRCGSESTSEVAMLDNNHLSHKKAATKSSSSDTHAKSKGIQLKLNTNAVSHVKNDDLVLESEPLTPATPICCPPKPTAGISQKPPAEGLEIGLDHLVKLKCEKRRLVFCFACLAKLEASNHVTSTDHHINCVKVKFPSWSGKPGDEELSKMVARLHDEEKASKVEAMNIKVSFDVYKDLKGLPLDKALEKVRHMRKKKFGQRQPSSSANEASSSSTSTHSSVSPCDITSSDPKKDNCQVNPQISIAQPIKQLPVAAKSVPSPSPPIQKPTSKVAPWSIKGSTTDDISNLSRILSVKGTSVIGLCFVWECRVVPPSHSSFYLCESCSRIISLNDICDHMRSTEHHSEYLKRQYPQFMYWTSEELYPWMKKELTDYIADLVKCREVSMDAQTVLLSEECFELVRDSSFVKALNVVQRIKHEKKTTTLPLIVLSQEEVEPREQQRTQLTLDTSNTLADLANQMDTSITELTGEITESDLTQHESSSVGNADRVNAESCISPTDTDNITSPQITEALDSQSPAITISPKQPDEPADSVSNQNSAVSLKDENQEYFDPDIKACFDIASPLSSDVSAVSPVIDTTGISAGTLKVTSTDIKPEPDVQLGSASVKETSKVSPNLLEDNITTAIVEEQMTEECSPHSHSDANRESSFHMASSMVDHNANESPPLDPEEKAALDKHYGLLLIDFLKKAKHNMEHSRNQTSEPYTTKSPESNEEECKPPHCSRWDVQPQPEADTNVAAKIDTIVTENKTGHSAELPSKTFTYGKCVSKKNTDKPVSVNVLSDNLNKTTVSHPATQQSKDDEPEAESKVQKQLQLPKIQVQQKESKLKQVKTKDKKTKASDSQISLQTSQLEIKVIQTGSQCHSAVHSEIQQSRCQASQQMQKLQLNSDTQKASSRCPPHMSPSLMQSDSGAVQLQTQQNHVQVLQQTPNHELPFQSPTRATQFQNTPQQSQQMHTQVSQVHLQTQVAPLQHVTQLTQTAQPIESLVTPTPHDTMHFRRHANQQNTNFQVSQGPPLSHAATLPVTSDTAVVTQEHGQFVQTAYLTNADYSNTQAQFGFPHGSAYPEHFYHQLQTQYFTSMQPFLQNVQPPDFSRYFNPNTQSQPVAQNHPAWINTVVGGTSNAAYSNAVSFNTGNNQSYTYTHNSVQEYNRVILQNLFYTPSSAPTQTNSQFFPPRQ